MHLSCVENTLFAWCTNRLLNRVGAGNFLSENDSITCNMLLRFHEDHSRARQHMFRHVMFKDKLAHVVFPSIESMSHLYILFRMSNIIMSVKSQLRSLVAPEQQRQVDSMLQGTPVIFQVNLLYKAVVFLCVCVCACVRACACVYL